MLRKIEYLVIDVDGTMTDSSIYYDEYGNELKKFCTKDAAGFFVAKNLGIRTIVLTGRECKATERRMTEVGVDYLFQGIKDKSTFLKSFMNKNNITKSQIAYIGDDLNDLPLIKQVGCFCCPFDACDEVKMLADYVSPVCGGKGVVSDIIRHILKKTGEWDVAVLKVYESGK